VLLTSCRYLLPVGSYVGFKFLLDVHFHHAKVILAAKMSGSGLGNLPFVSNCKSPVDAQLRLSKKLDIVVAVFMHI